MDECEQKSHDKFSVISSQEGQCTVSEWKSLDLRSKATLLIKLAQKYNMKSQ